LALQRLRPAFRLRNEFSCSLFNRAVSIVFIAVLQFAEKLDLGFVFGWRSASALR
jgi:hypothetical protein